jgi:hypothetical protein
MTTEPELDKLIIDNIADLDATAKRIDALVGEFWGEVSGHLQSWAKENGWLASQDPDDPWVAPPEWFQGDDDYFAWFSVSWGPGDSGDAKEGEAYFDLSRFAGVGGGKLCVWLGFDGVKRSVWKPLFREAASQSKAGGFSFDEVDGLYLDCTPPPGSLVTAVAEDDYAAAFEPLNRALDAAHANWPLFDKLLKRARA